MATIPQERGDQRDQQRRSTPPDFFHYADITHIDQAFATELTNWSSEPILLPDAFAAGECGLRIEPARSLAGGSVPRRRRQQLRHPPLSS